MAIQSLRTDDCIDQVIELYSEMVYRLAFAQVYSKSDADDVFQEVFLRYVRKSRTFQSEEHRKAWFIRVTVNCVKRLWASPWFKRTVPIELVEERAAQDDLLERLELQSALNRLPQKYRAVLYLFYYEDMPVEQISSALNRKPSTVRAQLTRGRALLRELLKGGPDNG